LSAARSDSNRRRQQRARSLPPPGSALLPPHAGSSIRPGAGVGAFLLVIVTAGALAHVAVRLKGLEVAYDLGRERRITTDLEEQRRRLQIEIGMLKDPGRVISIARESLNMGPPASEAIRRLGSGTLSRPPAPPVAERPERSGVAVRAAAVPRGARNPVAPAPNGRATRTGDAVTETDEATR
jgi:cell division protein FtsL